MKDKYGENGQKPRFLARFLPGLYSQALCGLCGSLAMQTTAPSPRSCPPFPAFTSQTQRPPPPLQSIWAGPPLAPTLGVIAAKRTEGPFRTASFFKASPRPPPAPPWGSRAQPHSLMPPPPPCRATPGGFHSIPPANTAEETEGQGWPFASHLSIVWSSRRLPGPLPLSVTSVS